MYIGLLQSLLYITLLLIEYTNCYSDYGDSNQFGIMDLFELDSLQYEVEILPLPIKKEDLSKGADKVCIDCKCTQYDMEQLYIHVL